MELPLQNSSNSNKISVADMMPIHPVVIPFFISLFTFSEPTDSFDTETDTQRTVNGHPAESLLFCFSVFFLFFTVVQRVHEIQRIFKITIITTPK